MRKIPTVTARMISETRGLRLVLVGSVALLMGHTFPNRPLGKNSRTRISTMKAKPCW